jgi:hypothetical protein
MGRRSFAEVMLWLTIVVTGVFVIGWAARAKTDGVNARGWVFLGFLVLVAATRSLAVGGINAVAKRPCPRCFGFVDR